VDCGGEAEGGAEPPPLGLSSSSPLEEEHGESAESTESEDTEDGKDEDDPGDENEENEDEAVGGDGAVGESTTEAAAPAHGEAAAADVPPFPLLLRTCKQAPANAEDARSAGESATSESAGAPANGEAAAAEVWPFLLRSISARCCISLQTWIEVWTACGLGRGMRERPGGRFVRFFQQKVFFFQQKCRPISCRFGPSGFLSMQRTCMGVHMKLDAVTTSV
jgi:hypothetical protein